MRPTRCPKRTAPIGEIDSLRESINSTFDRLCEHADGVMLEFGSSRERNLAVRTQLLRWQLQLRVLFIVRIALLKFRLRLPGFEAPEPILKAQQAFDARLAVRLEDMAHRLSSEDSSTQQSLEPPLFSLEKSIQDHCPTERPDCLPALRSLLPLCRQVESILSSLEHEMFGT